MSIPLALVREGDTVAVVVDGRRVVVCMVEGRYFAVDGVCPHAGQSLGTGRLHGFALQCPLHRASFDVRDGRVLGGPTVQKLNCYPVFATGGKLDVDISRAW